LAGTHRLLGCKCLGKLFEAFVLSKVPAFVAGS